MVWLSVKCLKGQRCETNAVLSITSCYHFINFWRRKNGLANQICAWICFECLQKDLLGSSMCGYWVYLLHFSLFCISFRGIQTDQRYKLSFIFSNQMKRGTKQRKSKKTIRKDDPNQLSINEINALQTEQSNWGKKKCLFVFLFLFFVDVNACATSSSFSKLCSSHFVTSRFVLPKMSWWQNHNSRSLKDKFNTLFGKLNLRQNPLLTS